MGAALVVWGAWQFVDAAMPVPMRVLVAWLVFVFGPGLAVLGRLVPKSSYDERLLAAGGTGLVVSALTAHALGLFGRLDAFPWVSSAITGAGVYTTCGAPRDHPDVRRQVRSKALM